MSLGLLYIIMAATFFSVFAPEVNRDPKTEIKMEDYYDVQEIADQPSLIAGTY